MLLKRLGAFTLVLLLCLTVLPVFSSCSAAQPFDDVPPTSYAYEDVLALREMGITNGIGDNLYGAQHPLTRADFVVLLSRLLGWETSDAADPGFDDLPNARYAYATAHIAAAVAHGAVEAGGRFRPGANITREEMACMLVGALGLGNLAAESAVTSATSPFADVAAGNYPETYGHIMMAYDFGIINGIPAGDKMRFEPDSPATREQTAAMLMRLYRKVSAPLDEIHTFYHYTGGAAQASLLAQSDSVSFGWARLEYWNSQGGAYLNVTKQNSNQWYPSSSAGELTAPLDAAKVPYSLAVFMDRSQKVTLPDGVEARDVDLILPDAQQRQAAIAQIVAQATGQTGGIAYGGVTIDFEGLTQETYAAPPQQLYARAARSHAGGDDPFHRCAPAPVVQGV